VTTPVFAGAYSRLIPKEAHLPKSAVAPIIAASSNFSQIAWLALTLTPGLGPTRGKRLVEFLGDVGRVFNASLTDLEAAGLPAQAVQSLGTELARDEIAKANGAGIKLVARDDGKYPARLKQIYQESQ
jgi:DNA processing protein